MTLSSNGTRRQRDATPAQEGESLYQRLGGEAALTRVLEVFHARVLRDPRLSEIFQGQDRDRLIAHQQRFLAFAFGGAPNYAGAGMRRAHAQIVESHGIGDVHFDAVLEQLESALHVCGAGPLLICEVIGIAESTRDEVLGR